MFIGRTRELQELSAEITDWNRRTAVLVYGKRRVGKSTLIKEAARSFDGIVINHLCVQSTFEGNLDLIYRSVSAGLSLPDMKFDSLFAMMDFLRTLDKKILLIIDEYPYLKQTKKKNEVDSYMQTVIDRLPDNVKLILCGSYITIMKELLTGFWRKSLCPGKPRSTGYHTGQHTASAASGNGSDPFSHRECYAAGNPEIFRCKDT